jgi:hypothetical protein
MKRGGANQVSGKEGGAFAPCSSLALKEGNQVRELNQKNKRRCIKECL